MDISMRLDVYQHVVKDINEIENIVSGGSPQHAFAEFLVTTAYAESLEPGVESAAYRRRDRKTQVQSLLGQGIAGETRTGLLSVRSSTDNANQDLINAENADRMTIYKSLAQKNGTPTEEIQKVYATRLANDAPSGSQVENQEGQWQTK